MLTLFCALLGLMTTSGSPRAAVNPPAVKVGGDARARRVERYGELPLSFEANMGQTDRPVKFVARGQGYAMFFEPGELLLSLAGANQASPAPDTLRVKLIGANLNAEISGVDELPGKSNYFVGNDPSLWRRNIPSYGKVRYGNVYPGVDLIYYGNQRQLEFDFVLAPRVDPGKLRLKIEGASQIQVDGSGNLVLRTRGGEVVFRSPAAYQTARAGSLVKRFTAARYVLKGIDRVGFEIAAYDSTRPLVIDPVLSYATYLGGNGGDTGAGIAVDSSGNAYVTGSTASLNFPALTPLQTASGGHSDVFVTKLNAAGSALVYSTYLGGIGSDRGTSIAVDSSGNAYVTGNTTSSNFPTTSGVFQTQYGGNGDAFVAVLNPTGSALVYATYLGGSGSDFGQGIAIDSAGNAYVTGTTRSTDFPTLSPLQGGNDGESDVFVTKVNASGSAMVYSTYLGGAAADVGQAIAVDASGNAYVTGYTFSANFPLANALQSTSGGDADVFVFQLDPKGSALVYSTYFGGSGADQAFALALDTAGNVFITGDTASADFPTTPGVVQSAYGGNGDAFVAKLDPTGSTLVYSTFLCGSDADRGTGIVIDASGNATLTGLTQSSDFPTVRPSQASIGGGACGASACPDTFVSQLDPQGASLFYSTFLGGSGPDTGQAIVLDSSGNAYVTGGTASANFTVITGAFQGAYGGAGSSGNAFVAKIDPTDAPGMVLIPQTVNFGNQALNFTSAAKTVTVTNAGSAGLDITGVAISGDFAQTNNCVGTLQAGGGTCGITVTFSPTDLDARTGQITLTDSAAGSPHQVILAGTGVTPAPAVTLTPTSLTFTGQMVGSTSASQTVTLSNSGTATLNITSITVTGDFAQTNTCGPSLDPGASCGISVAFTPSATGSLTSAISITDDATGSPQTVSLKGTGTPTFSLSSANPSSTILIGTDSTTFTVSASALSSSTDTVTLSCETGVTCSFNPSTITAGQSSTLTVSGLSKATSNPTNFAVDGTSGRQTAKLSLSVFLSDFSLSVSPPLDTIAAGQSATYTVAVSPVNGFNQAVTLSCSSALPQGVTCSFSSSSVTPSGSGAATSTLTVKTTTRSVSPPRSRPGPTSPGNRQPPGLPGLIILACASAILAGWAARRRGPGAQAWRLRRVSLSLAVLLAMIFSAALSTGCGSSYLTTPGPATSGTPGGVYGITITGTLGSNNAVARSVTVNLGVS